MELPLTDQKNNLFFQIGKSHGLAGDRKPIDKHKEDIGKLSGEFDKAMNDASSSMKKVCADAGSFVNNFKKELDDHVKSLIESLKKLSQEFNDILLKYNGNDDIKQRMTEIYTQQFDKLKDGLSGTEMFGKEIKEKTIAIDKQAIELEKKFVEAQQFYISEMEKKYKEFLAIEEGYSFGQAMIAALSEK